MPVLHSVNSRMAAGYPDGAVIAFHSLFLGRGSFHAGFAPRQLIAQTESTGEDEKAAARESV